MTIKKKNSDYIIGLLVFLFFMLTNFYNLPFISHIDSKFYELGSGYVKRVDKGYDKVIVVNVDQKKTYESSKASGSEITISELIETLNDKGAELIGLTIPFINEEVNPAFKELRKLSAKINAYPPADKSPDFKKWVLETLSDIENNLGFDLSLQDILKKNNNLIIPVTAVDTGGDNLREYPDIPSEYFLSPLDISSPFHDKVKIDDLIFPDEKLMKSSLGFGHIISMYNETMGKASYPLFLSRNGKLIPSLPLRMAAAYIGVKPDQVSAGEERILIKDNSLPLINGSLYYPVDSKSELDTAAFSSHEIMGMDPSEIKGKVIFIGLDYDVDSRFSGRRNISSGLMAAEDFINIIDSNAVARPFYMTYAESIFLFILVFIFVIFLSEKGFFKKSLYFLLMLFFIAGILIVCFSLLGIWFKAAHIACGATAIYLCMLIRGSSSEKIASESIETSRLLGLNFQSQGNLDQAFEKFRKLPMEKESMDLLYNLGREYENKKLIGKALEVYKYVNKGGGFRDLDERIPMLTESEDLASTTGSYSQSDEQGVLADPRGGKRSTVGRYKILEVLGKGSMGLVYKAQDPKINRIVAIKTIKFSDEFDEDVISDIKERFFMEAEIAGKLSHPTIVTIHDVGDDHDLTYMAMEFLEGEDLEKYIDKNNLLPIRSVLDVVASIADALDFAHKDGVIHRDIKPANIMLLKDGRVKVTDFGIAKAISSSKTKTGVILGTPNYMSPEQIMGQKIDSKSDIFSLGVLFYQLLTGELPFHGDNLSGLLYQITQVKHSPLRSYNKNIPKVCEQIIDKALMKDPAKRFKTANDMARVIRALAVKIDDLRMKKASAE